MFPEDFSVHLSLAALKQLCYNGGHKQVSTQAAG